MTEPKEPRKFWIHATGMSYNFDVMSDSPTIVVIEHSAYQALQSELEKVKVELAKKFVDVRSDMREEIIKLSSELAAEKAKSENLLNSLSEVLKITQIHHKELCLYSIDTWAKVVEILNSTLAAYKGDENGSKD